MEYIDAYNGEKIPRFIYKYFPLNNDCYNSILKNYLWFSDPLTFNDPYDCNLSFNMDFTAEDFRNYLIFKREYYESIGISDYSKVDIQKKVTEFETTPQKIKTFIDSENKKWIRDNYGVTCFSANYDNILMWSHYSDKHKGICIGFDLIQDFEFFKYAYNVKYPEVYPTVNLIKDRMDRKTSLIQFQLATKSLDWQYENEVRLIRSKNLVDVYRGAVEFKKKSAFRVYFGYKVDTETISRLKDLFVCLDYNVDFYRLDLKNLEFGLVPTEI